MSAMWKDILSRNLILRLKVTGKSMTPFLIGGEVLTIKNVRGAPLRLGDLILYKTRDGSLLLHRIVSKGRKRDTPIFQTKGDALLSADEPVFARDVLGKVIRIEKMRPEGKTIHIDMESLPQRSINYLIAIAGLYKSRVCFAVQKSSLYPLLRLVKKTLVKISAV